MTAEPLRRTPLHQTHVDLGGRMVPFGGWDMPVQYEGIIQETKAVRNSSGIFDVSHMGRVEISGPAAAAFLNRVLSFDPPGLRLGRARYGVICAVDGGIIDDCITYRRSEDRYLLIPNAGNTPAVLEWLDRWARPGDAVTIDDVTSRTAMIAHQGPEAAGVLGGLTELDLASVKSFCAIDAQVAGGEAFLARTGYTGEDGFEAIVPADRAVELWTLLRDGGATPCGLGARDVLRLEAGMLLHGNDMDSSVNPAEAGLGRFVDPDRDGYMAGEALRRIRDDGVGRTIVGFNVIGRGIARHGYPIMHGAERIGTVTSGSYSPTLDRSIGMGYVPTGHSAVGSRLHVDVRGRQIEVEVASLPFYSRRRAS